jgi:hypothetical protein
LFQAQIVYHGFFAIINTPSVFPELLNPVLSFNITSSKPVELIDARKSFPGIAPPSHLYQLSTMPFLGCGGSPTKTWSAAGFQGSINLRQCLFFDHDKIQCAVRDGHIKAFWRKVELLC